MEALLLAVRDAVCGRPAPAGGAPRDLGLFLDALRVASPGGAEAAPGAAADHGPGEVHGRRSTGRRGSGGIAGCARASVPCAATGGQAVREFAAVKQQLRGDGSRLREHVGAAKALLRGRLHGMP
jgi:hypothetical protein